MASVLDSYLPSQGKLQSRLDKVITGNPTVPNPLVGFPTSLRSSLSWTREEIEQDLDKCIFRLSDEDIQALEAACKTLSEQFPSSPFDTAGTLTALFLILQATFPKRAILLPRRTHSPATLCASYEASRSSAIRGAASWS